MNLEIRRNIYDQNGKEATPAETKDGEATTNGTAAEGATTNLEESLAEPTKKFFCYSCGNDCTRVRYHHSKSAPGTGTGPNAAATKYDLCPSCFLDNRRFPANTRSSEFTKLENTSYNAIPDRDAPWTDSETLQLLEGLEMYDDDWNKIADYVGTRTREECVLKFLQLEIEDEYLEPVPKAQDPLDAQGSAGATAYLGHGRLPLSQSENPVLSVMSYLAGLADPNVTAAAAGKAVGEVRRIMQAKMDKEGTSSSEKGKEKEQTGAGAEATKAEPATMEVDESSTALTTTSKEVTTSQQNPIVTMPFALAAARSSALASHEERSLTRLINAATNMQLSKLKLKLEQFTELENLLSAERRDLERRRQQLFLDRLAFQKRCQTVEDAFSRAMSLDPQDGREFIRDVVRQGRESEGMSAKKEAGENSTEAAVAPLTAEDKGFKSIEI